MWSLWSHGLQTGPIVLLKTFDGGNDEMVFESSTVELGPFVYIQYCFGSAQYCIRRNRVVYAGTVGFFGLTWTLTGSGVFQQQRVGVRHRKQQSRAMVPCGA